MSLPLVVVLGIVAIGVSYNQRMLDPLTVLIARDLGTDIARVVLLSPAFTLPYALGQPLLGPFADAVGKAKVLRYCMLGLIVSSAATLLANDYNVLVALRLLAGFFGGGIIPVSLALIADRTPVERRQVAMSHFMMVLVVSQIFTAPVSAYVAQAFDWHATVVVSIGLAVLAFPLLLWRVKPNPAAVRTPFRLATAAKTYRAILADRRARACYAAVFAEGALIFGITPHIAPILEARQLGGTTEAGYVLAGMGGGGLVYASLVATLVKRFDIFQLMTAGAGFITIGLLGTAFSMNWQTMALAYAFLGFGFYMLHSGIQTRVTEVMPSARASVVSLHAFSMFIGIALGPIIVGWVMPVFGLVPTLIVCAGAMLAVAFRVIAFLRSQAALEANRQP